MLTLVTVIYGEARQYRVELFGSVLSLLKHRRNPDTRIVVYTDRPLDGFPLPVTERIITADEWESWTRGTGITHLVKLHLVRQTLDDYGGSVIYFDTDTLFLCAPEQLADRLSPSVALMHAAEGPISDHEICANITEWLGPGRDVAGVNMSPATRMHNSGIVGVVGAHRDALMRSVAVADALHEIDPIFSLDQLSTGASLSEIATVETCEQDVVHYWGWNRAFVRAAIDNYWHTHGDATISDLCTGFRPETLVSLPHIHMLDKLGARWLGWRNALDADGRFACLALLAARRAAQNDQAAANDWVSVHLDFLDRMSSGSAQLTELLAGHYASCRGWLNSDNARRLSERCDK